MDKDKVARTTPLNLPNSSSTSQQSPTESSNSPFARLPTELVISIFEIAASSSKPTAAALALTCRMVKAWVEPILYRTVVLHSKTQNELFERTLRTKDPGFFQRYLRSFAPARGHGWGLVEMGPGPDSGFESSGTSVSQGASNPFWGGNGKKSIQSNGHPPGHGHGHGTSQWRAMSGVRALVMSTSCRPTDASTGRLRPHEVAIRGFVRASFFAYPAFQLVSHLFLCDVPLVYTSVLSQIIPALPSLPALTHLACPFSNKWRGGQHNVYGEVCVLLDIPDARFPSLPPNGVEQPQGQEFDIYGQPLQIQNQGQNQDQPPPTVATPNPNVSNPPPRPQLQMLLLNIFHYQEPDLERESYIWSQLAPIDDGRLYLQPGEAFSVTKWEENVAASQAPGAGYGAGVGWGGEDLWERAKRGAEGWRSWVR